MNRAVESSERCRAHEFRYRYLQTRLLGGRDTVTVLAIVSSSDRQVLGSLYTDVQMYNAQFRALDATHDDRPQTERPTLCSPIAT